MRKIIIFSIMFIIFTSISSISAQEFDEKNIEELHSIGASLISEGRYEESIRYYDKILEIDPDEVRALLNKGSVLIQLQGLHFNILKAILRPILVI